MFEVVMFPSPQGGSETRWTRRSCCGSSGVSIPSRRVGDQMQWRFIGKNWLRFHPLKAGRRPRSRCCASVDRSQFPSPQGGSETFHGKIGQFDDNRVSIPSRRVGDFLDALDVSRRILEFPSPQGGSETFGVALNLAKDGKGFHPLKAGRRLRLGAGFAAFYACFHPLKAGRRLGWE